MKTNMPVPYALGAALLLLAAGVARSQEPATEAVAKPSAATAAKTATASPFGASRTISDSALQRIAGREDISQTVIARNTSNVSDNTVGDNSTTGTIAFDGQAFSGLHGLSVLSANTGNNVSINASLNVNVALRQ